MQTFWMLPIPCDPLIREEKLNTLAYVVYALINKEEIKEKSFSLADTESKTLVDLQLLLAQSPRELARLLGENPRPDAWPTFLPPEVSTPIRP